MDIVNAFLEKQLIPCLFSVAVSIGILILTVMAENGTKWMGRFIYLANSFGNTIYYRNTFERAYKAERIRIQAARKCVSFATITATTAGGIHT